MCIVPPPPPPRRFHVSGSGEAKPKYFLVLSQNTHKSRLPRRVHAHDASLSIREGNSVTPPSSVRPFLSVRTASSLRKWRPVGASTGATGTALFVLARRRGKSAILDLVRYAHVVLWGRMSIMCDRDMGHGGIVRGSVSKSFLAHHHMTSFRRTVSEKVDVSTQIVLLWKNIAVAESW